MRGKCRHADGRLTHVDSKHAVDPRHVVRWTVEPEMVFDIVRIELGDGWIVQWLDDDGSVVRLLREHCPTAESHEP